MSVQHELDRFVSIAEKEIGTKESGNNHVKYSAWYGMDGQPWCAMFVSWCAQQAGILTTQKLKSCPFVPKMSYTPSIREWYARNRRLLAPNTLPTNPNYPKVGDIVLIDSKGGTAVNHVGIVCRTNGIIFEVIEGNCSNMVKKVVYNNLVSKTGAKILYLCSNHTSY